MSAYIRRQLTTSDSEVLMTLFGEVLRVFDKTSIDFEMLQKIISEKKTKPRFRIFVLNPDESVSYEIPQEDIVLNTGSYSENYQQGQRRNLNITLVNIDGKYTPNINGIWANNKYRFDIGLEYNETIYWFPRGIYIIGNPDLTKGISEREVTLELRDKFARLEGKMGTTEGTYEIPVGTEIKKAIKDILLLDAGDGYPLDLKPIIYDEVFEGRVTPYTLTKEGGTSLSEMILDLAIMLNAECFYNTDGNLCFINVDDTTNDVNKPLLWSYNSSNNMCSLINPKWDFENVVNEVHIVGANINDEIYSAMSKNTNPYSPLTIERIGRRIERIEDQNIYSDRLAKERADYELRKFSILRTTITLDSCFIPLLLVNNLIEIEDEFFNWKREKFLIQDISFGLGTESNMTISCTNIDNLPFARKVV